MENVDAALTMVASRLSKIMNATRTRLCLRLYRGGRYGLDCRYPSCPEVEADIWLLADELLSVDHLISWSDHSNSLWLAVCAVIGIAPAGLAALHHSDARPATTLSMHPYRNLASNKLRILN